MSSIERYVWAEINLSAIKNNMLRLKSLLKPGVKFCPVIKADGYGHGATAIAKEALGVGADYLAVAVLGEALELRAAGFTLPVLVFGHIPPELAPVTVSKRITQTVYTIDQARNLSRAALDLGLTAKIHAKIDTGMSRLGVRPEQAGEFCAALAALPGIELEGAFTHFATADNLDKTLANAQFEAFKLALDGIKGQGVNLAIRHCCNSAGTMDMPQAHLDMVRPGMALYGLTPWGNILEEKADRWPIQLEPAMKLIARLTYVKDLPKGAKVGYGAAFTAPADMVLGTLPIGYADGYTRMLSGKAHGLVNGRKAPLVGRVCMDQCMIDLSGVPDPKIGDEVILFGPGLPVDELAGALGTINYELICMVRNRVPREYVRS
ncbi:MAG: alanine racemase [Deltaproteobacteria bacterium]|jgi:alanine racemase|nr:alanine racemase [Deltaproteobacteria bacterium]